MKSIIIKIKISKMDQVERWSHKTSKLEDQIGELSRTVGHKDGSIDLRSWELNRDPKKGFPDSSVGKECRRLQFYSWFGKIHWRRDRLPTPVFLGFPVAQLVKNPPAMWETWIQSLGWEDPLEKGKATHSSVLVWRIQSRT